MVQLIAGYAILSKRDLSAIGDVAAEVRVMLGSDDLSKATARQVHQAIHEYLLPSDKTFVESMAAARSAGRKSVAKRPSPAFEDSAPEVETPTRGSSRQAESEVLPAAHSRVPALTPDVCGRDGQEASLIEA